jgi:PTS system glucose-specific IIC component
MGMALAMYKNVDSDKKAQYKGMYVSAALAVFLTGVTEPLEFMFMFAAMPLYVVYAFIQGLAFAMADIVSLRLHSFGNIELLTRLPISIKAGLGMDVINFVICVIVFGVGTYFLANFLIKKFNYATPGRNGNYEVEGTQESESTKDISGLSQEVIAIINLLGGKTNISEVDACMTRLRVSVKDNQLVGAEDAWKKAGAMGLIVKDNCVQAVYGPKADILKSDIQDALDSGVEIPTMATQEEVVETEVVTESAHVSFDISSVATGTLIPIEEVEDDVFSQKMMGEGFAVNPNENKEVASPVSGIVTSVFPSLHAIGLETAEGLEVLVHMGLDTVQMKEKAFDVKVSVGETVKQGQVLAHANWDLVVSENKGTTIVVVFTNSQKIESFTLNHTGAVNLGDKVGTIKM